MLATRQSSATTYKKRFEAEWRFRCDAVEDLLNNNYCDYILVNGPPHLMYAN